MANVDDPFHPSRKPTRERAPLRIADPDGRPDVEIVSDVYLVTEAMTSALRADPEIYQRDRELIHVIRHADETDARFPIDAPIVRACPQSWVGDRVSRYARCIAPSKKGDWRHVPPPPARVRALVECGSWRGIRPLIGVIEAPGMRPDGSVIQTPGYDEDTRSLYAPNAAFPPVQSDPTHSDAVLAYARLADVFRDFPYVAPEHRSATIAALLTLLARPAIRGAVPCWVFDASSKRSGKSLQMDVVHIIATGRACSRMTFPDDDEKELESVLSSYALCGATVVPFDNIRNGRPFGGAPIDKCVTATDTVDLRVLGKTEKRTMTWRAIILASGNNVSFCGDMIARVLSPRLESPLQNPELVDLRDLKAFARENRTSLVRDALTILRAYVVAGSPGQGIRWGGFESWAALIPSALVWVGAPNPMGARRGGADDEDPIQAAEAMVISGLGRLMAGGDLTASGVLAAIYPAPKRDEPPDGHDDLRAAIDELTGVKAGFTPAAQAFGSLMGRLNARISDGKSLRRVILHGKTMWRVVTRK